jgi:hypothetical protein
MLCFKETWLDCPGCRGKGRLGKGIQCTECSGKGGAVNWNGKPVKKKGEAS